MKNKTIVLVLMILCFGFNAKAEDVLLTFSNRTASCAASAVTVTSSKPSVTAELVSYKKKDVEAVLANIVKNASKDSLLDIGQTNVQGNCILTFKVNGLKNRRIKKIAYVYDFCSTLGALTERSNLSFRFSCAKGMTLEDQQPFGDELSEANLMQQTKYNTHTNSFYVITPSPETTDEMYFSLIIYNVKHLSTNFLISNVTLELLDEIAAEKQPRFTFGCVSDIHNQEIMLYPESHAMSDFVLRRSLLKTAAAMHYEENLDLLVDGGDNNTGIVVPEEFYAYVQDSVAKVLRSAFPDGVKKCPVLYVTGNHDYEIASPSDLKPDDKTTAWVPKAYDPASYYNTTMRQDVGTLEEGEYFYENAPNGPNGTMPVLAAYHYVLGDLDFIVLNCGKYYFQNAWWYYYSKESVEWVARKLEEIDPTHEKTVFLLTHMLFSDSNSISNSNKGMQDGEEGSATLLKNILIQYPNLVMLYGHDHGKDTAYLRANTSQRSTLYDTKGSPMSTVDPTHVNGTERSDYDGTWDGNESTFCSAFMGSMRFYENSIEYSDQKTDRVIIQGLVVKVYDDRIVMQNKNYGQYGTFEDITINKELIPYTTFREVKDATFQGQPSDVFRPYSVVPLTSVVQDTIRTVTLRFASPIAKYGEKGNLVTLTLKMGNGTTEERVCSVSKTDEYTLVFTFNDPVTTTISRGMTIVVPEGVATSQYGCWNPELNYTYQIRTTEAQPLGAIVKTTTAIATGKAYLLYNEHYTAYAWYDATKSSSKIWLAECTGDADHAVYNESYSDKLDPTDPNTSWLYVKYKAPGTNATKFYLWNIGNRRFLVVGENSGTRQCRLSETPVPLKVTSGLYFRTGTGDKDYMCCSPQLDYPVNVWTNSDAGAKWQMIENPNVEGNLDEAIAVLERYTGIEEIVVEETPQKDDFIYDLSGRRLGKSDAVGMRGNLPKGIYIKNGRKFIR